ncbi:MOSC domain-containing protein [Nocardia goodfellowii]|uniref:MOSC domain-containing protein YiiM n=1 Tax=Nocardia goodfellowii TaxID=882446 RepID=A0ABS4Q7G7_9NOCA|nr:MOSC domain-containing protein [Nocardia goodfellowii]MBP2187635.1 MOSC domain-containing protein YiiM [Nocardia goodfellowii]
MSAEVLAVCVVHAELEVPGRVGRTAIDKRPVPGRVRVREHGLAGDHVADTKYHGGVHQAVYAYAESDAQRWAQELGRDLPAGWFGENLRINGLAVSDAVLGARWAIGDTLLEVSAPRVPCAVFQHWSGESHWVKRFALRGDTGAYLRVLTEGSVGAGDEVRVVHVPEHGITARDVFAGTDMDRLNLLLEVEPSISDDVRMQIERHARRHANAARAVAQRTEAMSMRERGERTRSQRATEPSASEAQV